MKLYFLIAYFAGAQPEVMQVSAQTCFQVQKGIAEGAIVRLTAKGGVESGPVSRVECVPVRPGAGV